MKKNVIFLSVIIAVFVVLITIFVVSGKQKPADNSSSQAKMVINGPAPLFLAPDIFNKEYISLKSYQGKVVIVNFWATWCPPCRAEIPDLIQIADAYRSKLAVIGVSVDQDGVAVIQKFYQDNKINYPVIMATSKMVTDYGNITSIPTTFILDKTGNVVQVIVGSRSREQYEEIFKPYL